MTTAIRLPRWGVPRVQYPSVLLGVLAALAVVLGGLMLRRPYGYDVDLTQAEVSPPFEIDGINALELFEGRPYRWTTDYPFVQVRHAFRLAPVFRASLTIRADRPDGPQPVTFFLNEQPLATVPTTSDLRRYTMVLPHLPDPEGSLRFAAAMKNLAAPGDPRRLGFISTRWSLEPLFTTPGLGPITPGELAFVVLAGLVLVVWIGRWMPSSQAIAAGCATAMGLLLMRLLYRPAPIPYTHLALIASLAVGVLPLFTRQSGPLLGLIALVFLASFAGALWPTWMTDDALISFRYAQNLVAGNGLVYNVGERVEGYTNFLWTMLAALTLFLGGDPVVVSYYAGVGLALLLTAATFVAARRYLGPHWAVAAAALLATSHSLLVYSSRGSGLETGLFALLLLVASHLVVTDRYGAAGLLMALATLTRPEGVLLLAIAVLHRVIETRRVDRASWRLVGAFALIGVPFFLWRLSYYGDLFPNTFYAKTGGGVPQALRGLAYTGRFALFAGGPVPALLLGLAAARYWRSTGGERRWMALYGSVLLVFTAYVVAVGGDHFPGYRFFTPVLPFLAVLLAAGARHAVALLRRPTGRLAAPLIAVAVAGLCVFNLTRSAPFDEIIRGDDESVWLWREIGWWLADHGRPGESMAAMGAGAIPYYSGAPTVDLLGLTDRYIARLDVEGMGMGVAGHEKRDPEYVLNVRKPTYIPALWVEYFGGAQALEWAGLYARETIVTRYGRRLAIWRRLP